MKLQIKLTYSTAGKAYGHRNIGENTSRFVLTMSYVIKVLGQFHVWIIPYLQKLNKYKRQFSDHILYQYHKKFYVFHRPSNQLNAMLKHLSLMLDGSKKNPAYKRQRSLDQCG